MHEADYINRSVDQRLSGWTYRSSSDVHYFSFEKIDIFWWQAFVGSNWKWVLYGGAIYVSTIFGLQSLMKNRPAMSLRMPLFWWNFGLGIFSIAGFVRTAPSFYSTLSELGFYDSICTKEGVEIPTFYWGLLFAFSKFVELGDTVFIVLRKRPLIFLQWYHHLMTLCVTWILAPFGEPIAIWYAFLNFGVHSLMYPYFAARALSIRVPLKLTNVITTLQFMQMVIGFGINLTSMYYQQTGHNCIRYPISIKMFGFVYGSFLLLFGRLFYNSVIKKGRAKKEKLFTKKIE